METPLNAFSISSSQSCGVSDVLGTLFASSWQFSFAPVTDDSADEVLVSSLSFKAAPSHYGCVPQKPLKKVPTLQHTRE